MNIVLESIWVDRGCFAVAGVVLGAVLGWLAQAGHRRRRCKLVEEVRDGMRVECDRVLASVGEVQELLEAVVPADALDVIKTRAQPRPRVDAGPTPRRRSQEEIKTKVLHVTPEVRAELARGVRR